MLIELGAIRNYINESLAWILIEGRVEDAREKFPEMSDDDFDALVANQPAGSNNKYLLWACKQVDDGFSTEVVIQAVRLFDGNRQRLEKKDINQYKDVGEVESSVDKLGGKSKSQVSKQASSDTDVIYQDDRFLVVRPFTTEASCKYGTGTKWCIAATATRNYFQSYSSSNNKFYFVIDKKAVPKSKESKYAIAVISLGGTDQIQVYDASDKLVSIGVVAKHVGENWKKIWDGIQAHVKKKPTTREVDEANLAVEEHTKALLRGEKVSKTALRKIAFDAKLTPELVSALIKSVDDNRAEATQAGHNVGEYWDSVTSDVMSGLTNRANQLDRDSAMQIINWVLSKPTNWHNEHYTSELLRRVELNPEEFQSIVDKGNESHMAAIALNVHAPADVKEKIAEKVKNFKSIESKHKVYMSLAKAGNLTRDQLEDALRMPGQNFVSSILYSTDEINLSPDLIRLLPIQDAHALKRLIELKNVPEDHVAKLLLDKWDIIDKYDMYELLKTTKFSAESFEKLWSKGHDARMGLLQNPSIGTTNLKKFATSKNSAYRFAVAHNSAMAAEDLDALSNDESVSTRAAVAANSNTSVETLKRLAGDEATAVRTTVADNSKTPQNILLSLKRDSDSLVRRSASKTLKSLQTTEATIRAIMNMGSLLLEELSDDEELDIMSPAWQDIPGEGTPHGEHQNTVNPAEFVAIFLLQNNGSATREEISDAFAEWRGRIDKKPLWSKYAFGGYTDRILRGTSAGGKGWFWSPGGINKGALFRLTSAGASAAIAALNKVKKNVANVSPNVTATNARKGRKYYVPEAVVAQNVTGYEQYYVVNAKVKVNDKGVPLRTGYNQMVDAYGSYEGPTADVMKLHPIKDNGKIDTKKTTYAPQLPSVSVPKNAEVEYVRANYNAQSSNPAFGRTNSGIFKYKGNSIVLKFPLWAAPGGSHDVAPHPRMKMPPVKKSPPPKELVKTPAKPPTEETPVQATAQRRGPKTTYKIYGKFKGHPAATRLKGQAYVADTGTQFKSGEQAIIEPEDGKLRVKKASGDHSQLWSPIDG